jgi:hypothetical protein
MAKRSDENPARSKLFEPLVARLRTGLRSMRPTSRLSTGRRNRLHRLSVLKAGSRVSGRLALPDRE